MPRNEESPDQKFPTSLTTDFMEGSECHGLFNNILVNYYIPLEVWYLRYAINQVDLLSYLFEPDPV